ncbi:TPA: hypothetical protein ACQ2H2_001272 [Klebsiella pneumoniae]|jgi:hypothetical protein|uniref:hypothetical protein n=1 Tax=Enterobacterales TaxID=91347 RepID=UPI00127D8706|nr:MULTISPECIES: hypothetical protein [Enterobacteriaceae]EAN4728694.1 hypothetical protein [Salmonella enterica]EBW4850763.1 hypothetical protein [Salmonella enterica subsp. enterica serovar Braenderup]EBY7908263.1 hypothetical protein [Salmonella enterica subsp. enterica serovar Enteritidis]EGF6331489.1 hypothetical protein [Salmonella enterica subsp. enterica serovar Mbandaka]EHB9141737.1 hypothetical protein [Shigella flexneri]EIK9651376.1 hypothetical protein [Salmonella enterica subsp. 
MKKDITRELKRLGLHNGNEFIAKAALIEGQRAEAILELIERLGRRKIIPDAVQHGFNQVKATYRLSGYINQALTVIAFKAYVNEPKENFKADIHWNI